ncbi:DUF551 domain-containing protein [Salmonella enterica subsp. enterica serovar Reading]|nr:DUF551 domain-containing protein [Salmonella enterica subsp. enterica serovar Reading]
MTTITKEWLQQTIAEFENTRDDIPFGLSDDDAKVLIVLKRALVSLDAEPVRYLNKFSGTCVTLEQQSNAADDVAVYMPLYAAPPVPVQVDIEMLASALKNAPLAPSDNQGRPRAPVVPPAIENAIEFIRSIAFHINEDDYHGKHIAHYMQQALAWLEGHSCSDDRLGKAENQPVRGNQAAESNRGNEWTGNPDIDNAIIMLDRIDTLESCDDDRIEAVKAVLRRLSGNSPVTQDGWISCSERMPAQDDWILIYSKHGEYMAGQVQGEYVELSDGTLSWLGNALFWMQLPEPPL